MSINPEKQGTTWQAIPILKNLTPLTIRVPKKDMQKLMFIKAHTGLSMNSICLLGIQSHNRKVLKDFNEDDKGLTA